MSHIPHKSLGMPMLKGIERWGTLSKVPHTFPTGSPPYLSIHILFDLRRFVGFPPLGASI